jgi:hypothetical protein
MEQRNARTRKNGEDARLIQGTSNRKPVTQAVGFVVNVGLLIESAELLNNSPPV